jgi:glutamyl-tRNA synthetase
MNNAKTLIMKQVITRFAPSPTGYLHIGGARTALFNYLFAKRMGGKFLLRIEDTDRERSTQAAIDALIEGLDWLGLKADEPPIFQFARANRHAEVAKELVAKGAAYYCSVSADELAKWREANPNAKFRSPFRDGSANSGVIRLKAPLDGQVTINDHVKGEVSVDAAELDDMVLLRSDGTPTYMLAVVVDDHDMGITHVIRGDDHFTNAFRQKLIYSAMNWEVPEFAHVPLIHGPDGAKLSKRHGALGVHEYANMGYLPEAMRNYLLRLGWSHGDDEIISDKQALEWFNLEHLGQSPARFDFEKLASVNLHYIKQADDKHLVELVAKNPAEKPLLTKAMYILKERSNNLIALAQDAKFLFTVEMDEQAKEKFAAADKEALAKAKAALAAVSDWNKESIEAELKKFMAENNLKMGQIGPALRALLTGTMHSPAIFDVMAILGKEETLKRLG